MGGSKLRETNAVVICSSISAINMYVHLQLIKMSDDSHSCLLKKNGQSRDMSSNHDRDIKMNDCEIKREEL